MSQVMFVLLVVTLLAVLLAGPGHRFGLLPLGPSFAALAVSALGAALLAVAGLAATWLNLRHGTPGMLIVSVFGSLVGLALCVNYVIWFQRANQAPPIHDITTDVLDPPRFSAILPLREDAPNPPEYAGQRAAVEQRLAYPDIQTLSVARRGEEVFAAALATAEGMGWRIVSAEQSAGRIEATDTTTFFGFKDDVVIRLRERDGATAVDVRSKSRVGVSDLGTNARRVRTFTAELEERLQDGAGS